MEQREEPQCMFQYILYVDLFVCTCVCCLRLSEASAGMLKICVTLSTKIKEKNLMVSESFTLYGTCADKGYEIMRSNILI